MVLVARGFFLPVAARSNCRLRQDKLPPGDVRPSSQRSRQALAASSPPALDLQLLLHKIPCVGETPFTQEEELMKDVMKQRIRLVFASALIAVGLAAAPLSSAPANAATSFQ